MKESKEIGLVKFIVARHFGVNTKLLSERTRKREVVKARQAAIVIIRNQYPLLSLGIIGFMFGNRDHSTVIHARKSVQNDCDTIIGYQEKMVMLNTIVSNALDKYKKYKSTNKGFPKLLFANMIPGYQIKEAFKSI